MDTGGLTPHCSPGWMHRGQASGLPARFRDVRLGETLWETNA